MTRRPDSEKACALERLGAKVVKGDFDTWLWIEDALDKAYGVYSVQDVWEHGLVKEIQQEKRVIDRCTAASP